MESSQIIKGLECCQTTYGKNCKECPYDKFKKAYITDDTCDSRLLADLLNFYGCLKNEAVIEFWGKLKAQSTLDERIVSVASGDALVKELTE